MDGRIRTRVKRENKIMTQVKRDGLKTQMKQEDIMTRVKNSGLKTTI